MLSPKYTPNHSGGFLPRPAARGDISPSWLKRMVLNSSSGVVDGFTRSTREVKTSPKRTRRNPAGVGRCSRPLKMMELGVPSVRAMSPRKFRERHAHAAGRIAAFVLRWVGGEPAVLPQDRRWIVRRHITGIVPFRTDRSHRSLAQQVNTPMLSASARNTSVPSSSWAAARATSCSCRVTASNSSPVWFRHHASSVASNLRRSSDANFR